LRYGIEYVSRRRWCRGVDIEDQSWRRASGELVEGSAEDADVYARDLDAVFDHEFIHRAVLLPVEPEDEADPVEHPALSKCIAPLSAERRAS
jgi:hypothetical protein